MMTQDLGEPAGPGVQHKATAVGASDVGARVNVGDAVGAAVDIGDVGDSELGEPVVGMEVAEEAVGENVSPGPVGV